MNAHAATQWLRRSAEPDRVVILQRFFKTGPGEYAEGDRFLGIRVPAIRAAARRFEDLPLGQLAILLRSSWHEERALALAIMVRRYRRGDETEQGRIFTLYLRNLSRVNNWDLVDMSAEQIVGAHLRERSRSRLRQMARSRSVWARRIAIMSTFHYIKRDEFEPALRIAAMLLRDDHDLIHKAVGWMLREIGKRDRPAEEAFLRTHLDRLPRTALRYAIEKFPEPLRRAYLAGEPIGPDNELQRSSVV